MVLKMLEPEVLHEVVYDLQMTMVNYFFPIDSIKTELENMKKGEF